MKIISTIKLVSPREYIKALRILKELAKRILIIVEPEEINYKKDTSIGKSLQSGNGFYVPGSHHSFEIFIPKSALYILKLRVMYNGVVHFSIGNISLSLNVIANNFKYITIGEIYLKEGMYKVDVWSDGNIYLDQIVIVDKDLYYNALLNVNFKQVQYKRFNPCEYELSNTSITKNKTKTILVFLEKYSPFWRLQCGASSYTSIPVYGYFNCFIIENTDNIGRLHVINLRYRYQQIGYRISITTLLIIILILIYTLVFKRKNYLDV